MIALGVQRHTQHSYQVFENYNQTFSILIHYLKNDQMLSTGDIKNQVIYTFLKGITKNVRCQTCSYTLPYKTSFK